MSQEKPNAITKYWLKYYTKLLCTLCGNTGVIDTRKSAISPTGDRVGRMNWCICPNGQVLRKIHHGKPPNEDGA